MKKIIIAGCGQLGSRYLEGMAKIDYPIKLILIEPNEESYNLAMQRWTLAKVNNVYVDIIRLKSAYELCGNYDIAIVATSANVRSMVVEEIMSSSKVEYIILEKILAQSVNEIDKISELIQNTNGAWVNTPRRMMGLYKKIKSKLNRAEAIHVSKDGKNWGIASNSIHLIDLTEWLSGEKIINFNTSKLSNKWIESKRQGFYEVKGELVANFSNGSTLSLKSNSRSKNELIKIISSGGESWEIDEITGTAISSLGELIESKISYQSEITDLIINEILNTTTCELTSFKESAEQHRIYLKEMLKFWNYSNKINDERIPIT